MKSNAITAAVGILMILACGAAGVTDAILLSDLGICGGVPLTLGMFGFAAMTALLPAGTVGVFSGPWWLPAVLYSGPLGISFFSGSADGRLEKGRGVRCMPLASVRWRIGFQAALESEIKKRGRFPGLANLFLQACSDGGRPLGP